VLVASLVGTGDVAAARPKGPNAPAQEPFTPAVEETDDVEDLQDAVGLTTAAQLYRRRDFRGALAELAVFVGTNPDSPHLARARFVMAQCLRELKRNEEAAAIYADLVRVYPIMADDSYFELGRTRATLKDHASAADALANVGVEHPRHAEAQRLLAWELYGAGEHGEVVKRFGAAVEEGASHTAEQRFVLGLSRNALGDSVAAAEDFREALLGSAGNPSLAARAAEQLLGLGGDGKALYKDAERKAAQAGLQRLMKADPSAMTRVLAELETKLPPGRLAAELRFTRGMTVLLGGNAAAGEAVLVDCSKLPAADPALKGRARLRAGDAARLQNRFRSALEHYNAAAQSPASSDAEAALFGVSDIASRLNHHDDARRALQDLLVRNPLTRNRPRALWSLGWIEYRAGNLQGARQFFNSLIEEGVRGGLGSGEPRALYWAGRVAERLGDAGGAQRFFAQVIDEYPVSYYAGLAEKRLLAMERATDPWPHTMVRSAALAFACPGPAPGRGALPGASDQQLLKTRELLRLGLTNEARATLDGFGQRVIPTGVDEDQFAMASLPRSADVEEAVALNLQLGRGKEAFTLRQLQVDGWLPARSLDLLMDHLRRSHPRKYSPIIESHAQKQGVSPMLIYALTRIESRFRPDAVSHADAHGLMQLIPETAGALASDLGLAQPSRAALHVPELNVRLGTLYVRRLMRRFGGEPVYALAAYNAGPGAVERWQKERGTGQVDEFVEEIPFDETRLYVKKVLASHRIYTRLYGDGAGGTRNDMDGMLGD